MADRDIQQNVIAELEFEPSIDATNIGVTVEAGIATLFGHVGSCAQKFAAEKAARRVAGVRAIASEIEVRFPELKKHSDDQIAARALDIIAWDTRLPEGAVRVKVDSGWVTLSGAVPWQFQRVAAEEAVRRLGGVVGVVNLVSVLPQPEKTAIAERIVAAFKRNADIAAEGVRVTVSGTRVSLQGKVGSNGERDAAEAAAWCVSGVEDVDNRLLIP
ncbi:BON domain-containing protein [Rhizobium sp. BK376]|uniref:BON domain-containing protein n=1 Tax=Rhizobium sp. BK376 TaxID=2512149 RepID=UPI001044D8A5|nr:BON domain-containing protein [Rhizobium sp. BK376]TCR75621.1 osmotically-inducible protein OsmY [Rhizobium sp. BK376]